MALHGAAEAYLVGLSKYTNSGMQQVGGSKSIGKMKRFTKSVSQLFKELRMTHQRMSCPCDNMAMLIQAASTFVRPSIYRHTSLTDAEEKLVGTVPDWNSIRRSSSLGVVSRGPKVPACKPKRQGQSYTSRYIGVHQTFPTRRWEAQYRRNGKPTSLGCFDKEEEAARAYDKMKVWCRIHDPENLGSGLKAGTINFDMSEYEQSVELLNKMSQDDLIRSLRSYGREQAAKRLLKSKKRATQ